LPHLSGSRERRSRPLDGIKRQQCNAVSVIAVNQMKLHIAAVKEPTMTTHVLQFVEFTDQDRKLAQPFGNLGKGDRLEIRIRQKSGEDRMLKLPPKAAILLQTALGHLLEGGRVAVLAEDQELSPNEAASILGISRPLVVHRMDIGDLPFRYVGKHRRTKLKDVLTLKTKIDARQAALDALAENTETLIRDHGL
jgi:hypothetical protein